MISGEEAGTPEAREQPPLVPVEEVTTMISGEEAATPGAREQSPIVQEVPPTTTGGRSKSMEDVLPPPLAASPTTNGVWEKGESSQHHQRDVAEGEGNGTLKEQQVGVTTGEQEGLRQRRGVAPEARSSVPGWEVVGPPGQRRLSLTTPRPLGDNRYSTQEFDTVHGKILEESDFVGDDASEVDGGRSMWRAAVNGMLSLIRSSGSHEEEEEEDEPLLGPGQESEVDVGREGVVVGGRQEFVESEVDVGDEVGAEATAVTDMPPPEVGRQPVLGSRKAMDIDREGSVIGRNRPLWISDCFNWLSSKDLMFWYCIIAMTSHSIGSAIEFEILSRHHWLRLSCLLTMAVSTLISILMASQQYFTTRACPLSSPVEAFEFFVLLLHTSGLVIDLLLWSCDEGRECMKALHEFVEPKHVPLVLLWLAIIAFALKMGSRKAFLARNGRPLLPVRYEGGKVWYHQD